MAANSIAYGFVDLEALFAEQVQTVGVSTVYDAVRESVEYHNRGINELIGSFSAPTTDWQKRFMLPGTGTLQPIDEWGKPRPVKESGYYDVGFPIQGGGVAWGVSRIANALMIVEEANRRTLNNMRRDADWMKRHLLAALFDNAGWTYDDEVHGNVAVKGLANSDAVTYVKVGGAIATDTHYLHQAGVIADATNPFPTIFDELMEHPSNEGGEVVCYVPTNVVTAVQGLTAFVEMPDPRLNYGANVTLPSGAISAKFGDLVLGRVNRVWVVEWRALPSNFIVAHAEGAGPFMKMRQYPSAALQGLVAENFTPDGAMEEARMLRYAGFGVENRVAALVLEVSSGGSYNVPTGYEAPLPV